METAARETPASRAAVPKIPGSLREEPDLPSGILILPFHPPNRGSHRPRRNDAGNAKPYPVVPQYKSAPS